VPWLWALARARSRGASGGARALTIGLVLGVTYFAGTLYWIPDVLVTYGGIPRLLAVPVAGLLIAYLALFPAAASWGAGRALGTYGARALWAAPLLWTGFEWLRGWLFTGFPWVSLGYSQARWLPIAQTASLVGVFGLSTLIVAVNVALFTLLQRGRRAPAAWLVLAGTVALGVWGTWRLGRAPESTASIRVGIVQGNVPQDQKWSRDLAREIFSRYLRLSREAAARGARLIVWPESSTPFFFEESPADGEAVRDLARSTGAWVLFGSDQIERGPAPRYYNAAFLLDPSGRTAGVYRKQHLVPFGEYVPLKSLLFFVAPLVEAVADFSPGADSALLNVDGHLVSTAICYEVVFTDLTGAAVDEGSQLLTTITNDAWYGTSSAPWQHFEQASMRAIEHGRYLVRAANTGISGIIDARGRVVAEQGLFETGVLVAEVHFIEERTLYSKIGDSFAWACAALSALIVAGTRRRSARP
jgi:apolipoprotein N-acyltransferase